MRGRPGGIPKPSVSECSFPRGRGQTSSQLQSQLAGFSKSRPIRPGRAVARPRLEAIKSCTHLKLIWTGARSPSKQEKWPNRRTAPSSCVPAIRWFWSPPAWQTNPNPVRAFFPLTVDYREYTYSAGKIPGGFIKREGRPSEKEILTSRLIDRPIRPLVSGRLSA